MSRKNDSDTPQLFEVEEYISFARKEIKTHEEFLAKFKPKKGSDECYTPTNVFECVYTYVREFFPQFNNMENLRPFRPDGNFLHEDYTNKIVIDNPPFSILSSIINFYQKNNIKFWLFAPTLTIMGYYGICDIVITKSAITYTNGALVNTSFLTNMFEDNRIELNGVLFERINSLQKKKTLKNKYPFILSGARLQKWVKPNNILTIFQKDTLPVLSSKYKVFGNGCYIREGVLPSINSDISKLTDEEVLYLHHNHFKPIC